MKLLQWEFEFDKDDAKIVIPAFLLALGLTLTPLNKVVLWGGAVAYYVLYFFLKPVFKPVQHWLFFRCPHCKSRDVILQGMNDYHGDVPYDWYLCNHCGETSIHLNLSSGRLVKPGPGEGAKVAKALATKNEPLKDEDIPF
jgi:hypothetical protein